MRILRGMAVAGIAQRLLREAQKPQNQAKVKQLIAQRRTRPKG